MRIKPGLETVQNGQPKQAVQRARGDAGKNAGQREEHRDVEDQGARQEGPVGKAVQPWEGNVARADLERHDQIEEGDANGMTTRKIIVVPCMVKSSL